MKKKQCTVLPVDRVQTKPLLTSHLALGKGIFLRNY